MEVKRERVWHRTASMLAAVLLILLVVALYFGVSQVQASATTVTVGVTTCQNGPFSITANETGNYGTTIIGYLNGGAPVASFPYIFALDKGETLNTGWVWFVPSVGDSVVLEISVETPSEGTLVASVSYDCTVTGPANIVIKNVTSDVGAGEPPPPPGIWLSDVCEPFDGFSGDGWTTVSSNAASLPWGTVLYVAASADGPWSTTEFAQPPYVISESQMDALAALVGAPTRNDVWMKASPVGTAANYGSMVQDREWKMDALCGN